MPARTRPTPGGAAPVAWAAHTATAVVGAGMVGIGGYGLLRGDSLGMVPHVFGIGPVLAGRELRSIYRPPDGSTEWFFRHVVFTGGAYTAMVTAALTVNATALPPIARWIGPTVVCVPIVGPTVVCYRRRFEKGTERDVAG